MQPLRFKAYKLEMTTLVNVLRIVLISGFIYFSGSCGIMAADLPNPLADLSQSGADWGIWIDNGLVNPGETVRMTVSVPLNTPFTNLPATLEVHPRYLEDTQIVVEKIPLKLSLIHI